MKLPVRTRQSRSADLLQLLQKVELPGQKETACDVIGREEAWKRIDRRVSAVRCPKCVVDIEVAEFAKLSGEGAIVRFLFCMKSQILEKQQLPRS